MVAHSSAERACANYLINLLFFQELFPDSLSDSSVDHHRSKKVYTRELSWHPSSPLTPGDSLDAGRVDTQRPLRSPPLTLPTTTACSHPCWLWPRRDAKEQHLHAASRHGW